MLARHNPEVKRTYSRLKQSVPTSDNDYIRDVNVVNENSLTLPIDYEKSKKSDKMDKTRMEKITDFFRVKRSMSDDRIIDQNSDSVRSPSSPANLVSKQNISTTSSPVTSVSNKFRQTYLDLGQKDLVSTQCPECLMHYNKSFECDLTTHKKFHANYLKGYSFNYKNQKKTTTAIQEVAPKDLLKWSKYRFYEIKRFDGSLIRRMEFFLNFLHVQLGAEPLSVEELKGIKYSAVLSIEYGSERIIGFALFEECTKVFRSESGCSESSIQLECTEVQVKSECFGVSRIWVDGKHRSRGLASLLLDLKCKGEREMVSFSQPTPAGFAFAKSYQRSIFKGQQCLIYLQ